MGQSLAIPRVIPNDWKRLDLIVNKIKLHLGRDSSQTFVGLTLTGLTASTLIGANASKALESVTVGTGLDYTRPNLTLSHLGIEALTDPGSDKILFWDDSASACKWLGVGNSVAITDVTIDTIQDIRTTASPMFAGLTVVNAITEFSTDGTMGGNSDSALPTEAAVVTYVSAAVAAAHAFKTITGITNDVVADAVDDSLTLSSANVRLTIVGTTATDTITFTADADLHNYDWTSVDGTDLKTGSVTQAYDAGLTSLAGLTYVSDSFIKVTATDTYAIRTIAETKTDLSLNLVENTALSTWAGTTNITTLGTIATVGNITIADAGTIGQASGPLLHFNDTDNFFEISGCYVGIGTSTPAAYPTLALLTVLDSSIAPNISCYQKSDDSEASKLSYTKERTTGQSCQDNDRIGNSSFNFYNDAGTPELTGGAQIQGRVLDVSNGIEDCRLEYTIMTGGVWTLTMYIKDGTITLPAIKAGINQAAAGATAGELWHNTNNDYIQIGV